MIIRHAFVDIGRFGAVLGPELVEQQVIEGDLEGLALTLRQPREHAHQTRRPVRLKPRSINRLP